MKSIGRNGILATGFLENSTILPLTIPLYISQLKTNFEFNFNGSEDVLKVSGDTDIETFGAIEVRMKFKLHSISATAWRSKPNISITIMDEDTGELFKLTQSNIQPILEAANKDRIGIFIIDHAGIKIKKEIK